MKKIILFLILAGICSCNKSENPQSKEKDTTSDDINRITEGEYPFQHTALKEGVAFIDNLLSLNNKIDKTAIYEKATDFEAFYNKKITMNGQGVSLKDWTCSSPDLFANNPTLANTVRNQFLNNIDDLIKIRKGLSSNYQKAEKGKIGYVGNSNIPGLVLRYVNGKGLEVAESVEKQIMGIILYDQIVNHHLGNNILQNDQLREQNSNRAFLNNKKYTELEYHWDIAFSLLGTDNREFKPKFIANYLLNEFQGAEILKGIDTQVYEAFKDGRKALEKADYSTATSKAEIIRSKIALLYAVRTVHYLKQAKSSINNPVNSEEYTMAFHPLSEAYGFIAALIVTRKSDGSFYINDYQIVQTMLDDFIQGDGFWDRDRLLGDENTQGSLENIAKRIGAIYKFNPTEVH